MEAHRMSHVAPIETQDTAVKIRRSYTPWLRWDELIAVISFLILVFFVFLSTLETTPPVAVPLSAPLTEFSSGRAMQHLAIIAQKPHPLGSAEHSVVRDYIVRELTAMGLNPEIQKTATSVDRRSFVFGAVVENVLAKLPGTQTGGKAVLLCAHYDTVPHGTGASDDGAGVVALLETLRALRAGPPLANDTIFLFTDGEETELLGATAFVKKHPAAKDVKVVLNFDALGKSGTAIMYDSTANNGWLIGELAKAAPKPVANSLAAELYRRMRFLTDLQILTTEGVQGLNFAYIDGANVHHTQLDSLETIDERSVQHLGSYALALARHFGNISLEPGTSGNAIFFSVMGAFLVHYPASWAIPLAIGTCALFVVVVTIGLKTRKVNRVRFGAMIGGIFIFLFNVIASALVVAAIQKVTGLLPNDSLLRGNPDPYNSSLYFLGFVAIAIAVFSTLQLGFKRVMRNDNLAVGALFPWLILTIYTAFAIPAGSYLFVWPLLFILIAMGVDFVVRGKDTDPVKLNIGMSLATLPAIVLIVPMIYFCFLMVSFQMSPRITAIFIVICMLPLSLLISQLNDILRPKKSKWLLPVAAVLVGIAFISVAKSSSHFDRVNRRPDRLFYAVNGNTGRAIWGSLDEHPDDWTSQYLTGSPERGPALDFVGRSLNPLIKDAPVVPVPAPDMKVISDTTTNGIRSLSLHITSARQAPVITVFLDPETMVRAFVLDGKRYDDYAKNNWRMRYFAVPAEGIELTLELEQSPNVVLRVTDQSYGLPEVPGTSFKPRPDYLMPAGEPYNDEFLVTKTFAL